MKRTPTQMARGAPGAKKVSRAQSSGSVWNWLLASNGFSASIAPVS